MLTCDDPNQLAELSDAAGYLVTFDFPVVVVLPVWAIYAALVIWMAGPLGLLWCLARLRRDLEKNQEAKPKRKGR